MISSWNSVAFSSEFLENLEEMFPLSYYTYNRLNTYSSLRMFRASKVSTFRLYNGKEDSVFAVRVMHSLPLNISVVQVLFRDKIVALSHQISSEQLPTVDQVSILYYIDFLEILKRSPLNISEIFLDSIFIMTWQVQSIF